MDMVFQLDSDSGQDWCATLTSALTLATRRTGARRVRVVYLHRFGGITHGDVLALA